MLSVIVIDNLANDMLVHLLTHLISLLHGPQPVFRHVPDEKGDIPADRYPHTIFDPAAMPASTLTNENALRADIMGGGEGQISLGVESIQQVEGVATAVPRGLEETCHQLRSGGKESSRLWLDLRCACVLEPRMLESLICFEEGAAAPLARRIEDNISASFPLSGSPSVRCAGREGGCV